MEIVEFVEMNFLRQRLWLLKEKLKLLSDQQQSEYPDREFTLGEFKNINSVIKTLEDIRYVYDR